MACVVISVAALFVGIVVGFFACALLAMASRN